MKTFGGINTAYGRRVVQPVIYFNGSMFKISPLLGGQREIFSVQYPARTAPLQRLKVFLSFEV